MGKASCSLQVDPFQELAKRQMPAGHVLYSFARSRCTHPSMQMHSLLGNPGPSSTSQLLLFLRGTAVHGTMHRAAASF